MAISIADTTLRDAHQSLTATRMRTRGMLHVAAELDRVGFFSFNVRGGATFDPCIRSSEEDPCERLRSLREKVTNTRLRMLPQMQSLAGYRHHVNDLSKGKEALQNERG